MALLKKYKINTGNTHLKIELREGKFTVRYGFDNGDGIYKRTRDHQLLGRNTIIYALFHFSYVYIFIRRKPYM